MNKRRIIGPLAIFFFITAHSLLYSKTWYVSNEGSDVNPGSKEFAFKTIARATALAMPGDTVYVLEGTYRERVAPIRSGSPLNPIVYLGEPGKKVVLKGSELWIPEWNSYKGNIYYAVPDDSLFNDLDDYLDSKNPFRVYLASTPYGREGGQEVSRGYGGDPDMYYTLGQVFVNGKQYKEVPYLHEADEYFTWHFDQETGRLYINFGLADPSLQEVEITTRRSIFAPAEFFLAYIVVEGFIMEHCGNQYPTNFWNTPEWGQRGALSIQRGRNWIIKNNLIRHVKTFAIDAGYVTLYDGESYSSVANITHNVIENNYILENGSAGILVASSQNMIIRNNVIMYNNTMGFTGKKRWEQAGIKCHNPVDGLISGNYIAENYCQGVWLDNKFERTSISKNIIVNNEQRGIFLELSNYDFDMARVDRNIIIGNETNQVYMHDASGATFLYNLLANTQDTVRLGQGIMYMKISDRTATSGNHTFYGNIFTHNPTGNIEANYPDDEGAPIRSDYNVFDSIPGQKPLSVTCKAGVPVPWNDAEFKAKIENDVGEEIQMEELTYSKGTKAPLTKNQWQKFWTSHGFVNDQNSIVSTGNSVVYDEKTHMLALDIAFDPNSVGSFPEALVDDDFFGIPIFSDGSSVPGPFQQLTKGINSFKIWDGLSIPTPGGDPYRDQQLYHVRFEFTENNEALPSVKVQVADQICTTDNAGVCTFLLSAGNYKYYSAKEDYFNPNGSLYISSDTTIKLSNKRIYADLRFLLTDEFGPASSVSVFVNGEENVSSTTGIIDFKDIELGMVYYEIFKDGFTKVAEDFLLQNDTLIEVFMEASEASVKFRVRDENTIVPGADISINNTTQQTNLTGITTFSKLEIDTNYTFVVSKSGYKEYEDYFFLNEDTVINVLLAPVSLNTAVAQRLQIYPNPASKSIYINGLSKGETVIMADISGKIHKIFQASDHKNRFCIGDMEPGSYFLVFQLFPSRNVIKIRN